MESIAVTTEKRQSLREKLSWKMAFALKPFYLFLRRNRKPWDVNMATLEQFPAHTLGHDLFLFLKANNLTIMPKIEFHDVYHVLFEYGTDIKSETLIQFVPLGNGRRSLPFLASTFVSALFYPEHWEDFYGAYLRGKNAIAFHDWDFEPLLRRNTAELRKEIFN